MGLSYIIYYVGYDSAIITQIGLMTGYQRKFFSKPYLAMKHLQKKQGVGVAKEPRRNIKILGLRLHYRFGNQFLQIPSNYFHSSAFHKRFSFIIKGSLVTATTFKHTDFYFFNIRTGSNWYFRLPPRRLSLARTAI